MQQNGRTAPLIAVALVAAVLLALAALFLLTPPPQSASPSSPPPGGQLVVNLPDWVWGILFLLPLLVGFAAIVYRRIVSGPAPRAWSLLILIVVGIVLLVLLLHAGNGDGNGSVGYVAPTPVQLQNNTTHNITNGNGSGGNGSGTDFTTYALHLPPLTLWLVAVGVCALIGVLAVPGVVSRIANRFSRNPGSGGGAAARDGAAAAFAEAADALDAGADPRDTIVRLYLQLLLELGTIGGTVTVLTAEEVRQQCLLPMGVEPAAAEVLTRLFEEARYSTHPLGPETVSRAREALRRAESSLRRDRGAS